MISLFSTFLDWIFPRRCGFCRELLEENEDIFCVNCLKQLDYLKEPLCAVSMGDVEHVYSAVYYEDPMSMGVHNFKFYNKSHLCKPFAAMMMNQMGEKLKAENCEIVTAVPMHPIRKRIRGYDQSELLAKEIAKLMKLPYEPCLKRVKLTKIQHTMDRQQRKTAQIGSFACSKLHGEKILLIDDVFTSGATLRECARVLTEAGASTVCAATLCRAVLRTNTIEHEEKS